MPVTEEQLDNVGIDLDDIAEIANGDAHVVTMREGRQVPTVALAINNLVAPAFSLFSQLPALTTGTAGYYQVLPEDTGTHASVAGDVGASGGLTPNSGYFSGVVGTGYVRLGASQAGRAETASARSQAWAQSPTAPDPADPTSKSAKGWAADAAASALAIARKTYLSYLSGSFALVRDDAGQSRVIEALLPNGTFLPFEVNATVDAKLPRTATLPSYYPNATVIYDSAGKLRVSEIYAAGYTGDNVFGAASSSPASLTPETWYVFLCIGQSNMDGRSGSASTSVKVPDGVAYKWQGGALVPFTSEPSSATSTGGSLSAFAAEFYRRTGFGVIIINTAVSGTSLIDAADQGSGSWGPGGTLRANAISQLNQCKSALDTAGFAWQFGGCLWSQGEREGNAIDSGTAGVTQSTYFDGYGTLLTYLQTNTQAGTKMPFVIARTGRMLSGDTAGYQAVRAAQRDFVRANTANSFMGWTGAIRVAGTSEMVDEYHYTQPAYNRMGVAMATVVSSVCLGRI